MRLHGESAEVKDEVTRLARQFGIVTPYTAYLIMEDEHQRHVPLAAQNMRELSADVPTAARTNDMYKSVDREAKDERSRNGAGAVDNAENLAQLRNGENLEQAAQMGQQFQFAARPDQSAGFALAKAPSPSTQPGGYRVAANYAQQARVIKGRAFYQNGDTWTDSTWQTNTSIKTRDIKFGTDEYFDLVKYHPEANEWFALGEDLDIVLDGALYQVRHID